MCFVGLNRRKNHCAGVYFVASVAERLPTHLLEPFASVVGYRLLDEHTVGQYVAVLIACFLLYSCFNFFLIIIVMVLFCL